MANEEFQTQQAGDIETERPEQGSSLESGLLEIAPKLRDALNSAAKDGYDIVFGENHRHMGTTMNAIGTLIADQPPGHFSAIIIEQPIELQPIYDANFLNEASLADFTRLYVQLETDAILKDARTMYENGSITGQQFQATTDFQVWNRDTIVSMNNYELTDGDLSEYYGPIFNTALTASSAQVPVLAVDIDRDRIVMSILSSILMPEDLRVSAHELEEITSIEISDVSDLNYIQRLGHDLGEMENVIIQRGYRHIANDFETGFDDLLEAEGREVVTVSILPEGQRHSHAGLDDTADLQVAIGEITGSVHFTNNRLQTGPKMGPELGKPSTP